MPKKQRQNWAKVEGSKKPSDNEESRYPDLLAAIENMGVYMVEDPAVNALLTKMSDAGCNQADFSDPDLVQTVLANSRRKKLELNTYNQLVDTIQKPDNMPPSSKKDDTVLVDLGTESTVAVNPKTGFNFKLSSDDPNVPVRLTQNPEANKAIMKAVLGLHERLFVEGVTEKDGKVKLETFRKKLKNKELPGMENGGPLAEVPGILNVHWGIGQVDTSKKQEKKAPSVRSRSPTPASPGMHRKKMAMIFATNP